jgi:hypothetical protein
MVGCEILDRLPEKATEKSHKADLQLKKADLLNTYVTDHPQSNTQTHQSSESHPYPDTMPMESKCLSLDSSLDHVPFTLPMINDIDRSPSRVEKPYITCEVNENGYDKYYLVAPSCLYYTKGALYGNHTYPPRMKFPFEYVHVVQPIEKDAKIREKEELTETIQLMLNRGHTIHNSIRLYPLTSLLLGYHIVFTPGIYYLTDTLVVSRSGQILLGLGLATLVACPNKTIGCIYVLPHVPGVQIAGLMLQASKNNFFLLQWGNENIKVIPTFPSIVVTVAVILYSYSWLELSL